MLPRAPSIHQRPIDAPVTFDIGVGIDTSRYGHYAALLDADLQTAAADLEVIESATGYGKLRQRLADLVHVMRKLLHLTFAIWKTGQPFDPKHYPWGGENTSPSVDGSMEDVQAAGLRKGPEPIRQEVATACPATVADATPTVEVPSPAAGVWLDFTHLKRQLPMARVLDHLGLTPRLKGAGAQRRCACPIHRGDGRGRTFSVNLETNAYQCFDARCASQGDVIDLWAALHQRDLRAAALDLVHVFALEPSPTTGTEKRNG
jgi:hypothetical protein